MTDRHMDKAREIIDAINRDEVSATPAIATALAEAERAGMRRAAEIVQELFVTTGLRASEAILAEAGGSDAG